MISSAARSDGPSASGVTRVRSSAEEWYSGKSPCGVRESVPTGRSNPGEQYWRSSPPLGCQSPTMLPGSPRQHVRRRAVDECVPAPAPLVAQRSWIADAGDHEAVVHAVERSRGCGRASRAARACRGSRPGGRCASAAAAPASARAPRGATIPERLSFASAGWQTYVLRRNSASCRAGDGQLARGEGAVLERRVDDGAVVALLERVESALLMQKPHCSSQYEVRKGTRSGSSRCVKTCSRSSRSGSTVSTGRL